MKLTKSFWINFALAILISGLVLGWLQYSARGVFADPDGFYHAKASQLLSQGKLTDTFPWLYYTTWNTHYADQHYLYHWLLVPFNTIQKLPFSIVLFGLVFISLFLAVLRRYKSSYFILWIILLLGSSTDFLFRINVVKANTLSLALLCLITLLVYGFHYAHNSKQKFVNLLGIGLVSAIFVWTYGGFVFVPFLLLAYFVAGLFAQLLTKVNWELISLRDLILPLLISILGITIGMVLHPQHGHIFSLMYDQLFQTGLGAGSVVPVGNEWHAFNFSWFIQSNVLTVTVWGVSFGLVVHSVINYLKRTPDFIEVSKKFELILWLQFTSIGLLILTLWHRRFIEYWIPFALLAAAVTIQPYLENITKEKFIDAFRYWQMKVAVLAVLIASVATIGFNVHYTLNSLRRSESSSLLQPASEWLKENSNAGDIVFNTEWDQFPQIFYWNDKDYYIVGLDPTFMYIENPSLYWDWRKIADDKPKNWDSIQEVYDILKNRFKAKYVFLDTEKNVDLYDYLVSEQARDLFEIGFEDSKATVFVIK
jgi:hypothetical protein